MNRSFWEIEFEAQYEMEYLLAMTGHGNSTDANRTIETLVNIDEIDPGWLTRVLSASGALPNGSQVVTVQRETCGTGQLADSYRFTLTYDPPASGPSTVVGKFASRDMTSRAFGQQSGYYRNEVRFYQELAPTLSSVALPSVLHAELAANETDFVLLMDDLAPARVVDQITGCSADEAALVMEQVAALHAASWQSKQLAEVQWLKGTLASFIQITDNFPQTLAAFRGNFGDLVPEADIAEATALADQLNAWKQVLAAQPQSLWHSDLRADNLLFDARNGTTPVVLLDWQGVGYGYGPADVAYYLGTSLTTADRRAHERDLIALYHEKLVALGVQGYSADDAWADYRVLAIHALQTGIYGLGAVRRSERGDAMWRSWIERGAQHTRDLDSFTALKGRR